MGKLFCGIDPGLTGALAVIYDDATMPEAVFVYDAPVLTVVKSKSTRHELDAVAAAKLLRQLGADNPRLLRVAIERVSSMPGQGVASSFAFGKGFGIWLGILAAYDIAVDLVHPTRWKKVMLDGMGKEKDASRVRAKELFPSVDLSLRKHHGRADALLLAEYRRRIG